MESTTSYWRPIYNLLEGHVELLVVTADHIKAVPGRKTDVKDAQWMAELLRHGLVRASFIPPPPSGSCASLTRYRTHLIEERARLANRLQVVLEDANIKLASVVTDVRGVSARAILHALVGGRNRRPGARRIGARPAALQTCALGAIGRRSPHRASCLHDHRATEPPGRRWRRRSRVGTEIAQRLAAEHQAIDLLDTIPGVSRNAAEILLAEIGTTLGRFPNAQHLASWDVSRPCRERRQAVQWQDAQRQCLAPTVVGRDGPRGGQTKNTSLAAQYRRIAARRGKKRALVAVAHTVLVIIYHILTKRRPIGNWAAPISMSANDTVWNTVSSTARSDWDSRSPLHRPHHPPDCPIFRRVSN